ncbi:MAG: dihydrofolate reductase [Clostridiales bacterium]|nr:dihydrofolate reductase [Clostridiales bacterium]
MKAILHADKEWGIGKNNDLMFSIPADMKFFRETTTGNVVVMGSNTLKSFPGGKPLKNRINIVLNPTGEDRDDCLIVRSLDELFAEIKKYDSEKVFVVGGAMMYKTLLPYCTEVLVTRVDAVGGADRFFENLDENKNYKLTSVSEPIETNGYIIRFTTYTNLKVKEY